MPSKELAARRKFPVQSIRREMVVLPIKATFTSGAFVLDADSVGVASVADTGTGIATFTLTDRWAKLIGWSCEILPADGDPPAIKPYVAAEAVTSTSAPTVRLETVAISDNSTMTDPEAGDVVSLVLFLLGSSNRG